MKTKEYERYWTRPDQPLKSFGDRPFSKGRARAMVGFSFVEWALKQGLLEENDDGSLRVANAAAREV